MHGKVALITGAARGIGREVARQMCARGASVLLVDLDRSGMSSTVDALGGRAVAFEADVTDAAAMAGAVDEAVSRFGGVDVVVPAAGVIQSAVATTRSVPAEEWERVLEVDLLGVWRTVRAALPQVVGRHGQVVLTSSIFAFSNGIFNSPYAVAKAGGEALGRALRAELAPSGASATIVYFAAVETRLLRDSLERPFSDRMEETLPRPMRKVVEPEKAAAALVGGLERRASRVFVPGWWRYVYALRGITMPLIDRHIEKNATINGIVREVEAEAG